MIYYLAQAGTNLLWFFLFPIIGHIVSKKLPKTINIIVLVLVSILFLPLLAGYSYLFPLLNEILFLFLISFIYSLVIKRPKWTTAFITCGIAFFCLGVVSFWIKMMIQLEKNNEWEIGNYKIEYFEERGFSGGSLLQFKLSEYSMNNIFLKEIETAPDINKLDGHLIIFHQNHLIFDKYEAKLMRIKSTK